MIYKVESTKTLGEVTRALEAAAQRHKFGVIAVHDLKAKLKEKGVDFEPECLIYELCNPQQAKKALEGNLDVSTALPCRISVYKTADQVVLSTIRPTAQIGMFNVPELQTVAEEVEKTILAIMNESA
ncbi:MAG: DUF302 domain-containing protein [Terriglobia bacterium]|jgi:uncharacterized protein (DUF302 family)